MQPSSDQPKADRSRQLKRYGPIAAVALIAVVAIVVVVVAGGGGSDDKKVSTTTPPGGTGPKGAISWDQAKAENLDVTFPKSCDPKTGRIKIPNFFAAPCFADVKDNGGATSNGVTGKDIVVVAYVAQEHDAVLDYITAAIKNNDTSAQVKETIKGYVDMYNSLYQLYGRQVKLKFLDASGGSQDEVAARADAVKAATEMGAFAVLGGPVLTSAFADELAARKVICLGCTAGAPDFYEKRAPYLFNPASNGQQVQDQVTDYIIRKLAGNKASHGGPAVQNQTRKFGYLWIESNDDSKKSADRFSDLLNKGGVKLAQSISFQLDPARLQEQGTSVIAKLKAAGVTSVVLSGDPVSPGTFTKEATAQNYFPEWIIGPSALVDTNAFGRTYDQKQWIHAFGPSALAMRTDPNLAPAYVLYKWFTGKSAPAKDTANVLWPNPASFFAGLEFAGPTLTPENFRDGMFAATPTDHAITQPSLSYGHHKLWPYTDYNGVDDMTEVWWNPDVSGPDEIRKVAKGMWEFVDGGARHLPGEWDKTDRAFDPKGAKTMLEELPPDEVPPDYPSPAAGS